MSQNHRPRYLLAVTAALALLFMACRRNPPPAPPIAAVTVAPAARRTVTDWNDFTGQFVAVQAVEVRPRVSGYVVRVAYREGAEVQAGDTLFLIDSRPYAASLATAKAQLSRAESAVQLAIAEANRAETLFTARAMARAELEARTNTLAQSQADLRAAQAAVETTTLDVEWTTVRAPIGGRIGRAAVTAGNYVQSGAAYAPLTTIVSQDPMYVYFNADEQSYLRLTGRSVHGKVGGGRMVGIGLSDEKGYPHTGRIDFVDNQLDGSSGTIRLRAVLENHDRHLTPGLFARVRLAAGPPYEATVVEERAVSTDQDKKYVYVIKPDSTVEYRPVQLGPVDGGFRVLASGVAPGEPVVVDGLQRIRPGVKVAAQLASRSGDSAGAEH